MLLIFWPFASRPVMMSCSREISLCRLLAEKPVMLSAISELWVWYFFVISFNLGCERTTSASSYGLMLSLERPEPTMRRPSAASRFSSWFKELFTSTMCWFRYRTQRSS